MLENSFKFDTSYKMGLAFEEIMLDESIEEHEREELIYALFGTENLANIVFFYTGGKILNKKTSSENIERPYSFIEDWDYIYAAFYEVYGIDLDEQDIHWWKFLKLMKGLHDTVFNSRVELRLTDTSKIKDQELKRDTEKRKRAIALSKPFKVDETLNKFNALFDGGD